MVVHAHTIIDPRAVMVEPLHAPVAYATVPGAVRPNDLAVSAQEHRVKNLHQRHEINVFGSLQVAGILAQGDHVQGQSQYKEDHLKVDQRQAVVVHFMDKVAAGWLSMAVVMLAYLRGKRYKKSIL